MAKLIGMSGDFKAREFAIEQGEISIGRKVDNTIVLDHPTISSHHCRILHSGDTCVLQDLDSTNGTRVNSRDVKESALRHKDLIQLGTIEFLFDAPELATSGARYTDAGTASFASRRSNNRMFNRLTSRPTPSARFFRKTSSASRSRFIRTSWMPTCSR